MVRALVLSAVLVVAGIAAPDRALAQSSELYGRTITAIEFEPDIDAMIDDLLPMIPMSVGEPLTVENLQRSIKALYATGRFRDIRAHGEAAGDEGVEITFRVFLQRRIGSIAWELEGEAPPGFRLEREIALERNGILRLSAVDRAAVRTRRQYVREGYLEATVDPSILFDSTTGLASITFYVTPGPRAQIGAISFDGDLGPYDAADLLSKLNSRTGNYYDVDEARRDADRIQNFLYSEERRLAEATLVDTTYDEETNVVDLTFSVETGPEVAVAVTGVPEGDVRKIVAFGREEPYSLDKVDNTVDDLIEHYQRRGHYFVTVDAEETRTPEGIYLITYSIEPGDRFELGEISFRGNETFPDDRLREIVATSRPGFLANVLSLVTRRKTGVTTEQLTEDADAIEAFYRLEGFIDPDIANPIVEPNREQGTIDVIFPIREGPRVMISEVTVEGPVLDDPLPALKMRASSPLNPQLIAEDVANLQQYYTSRGYFDARVRAVLPDDPVGLVPLTYQVAAGSLITIGSVNVSGNTYTDTDLILNKARLRTGEPLSWNDLIQARQRLYGLGIFSVVEVLPQPAPTDPDIRNITIRVQEGKFLTVSGSVGYSSEDEARGTASVSHRNLMGEARYLGLETTLSQRVNRVVLNYREPLLFGYDLPTQISLFRRDELRADEQAELESVGTSVELTRIIRGQARWGLRYEYRVNDCVAGALCELAREGVPIIGLQPENQEIQISSITPSFFWDRRDDLFYPSEGFYAGLSLEYAFPLYRAETNFVKGFFRGAYYFPLTESSQLVVSAQVGAIEPLETEGPGALVPFAERFLAGGEITHRAFELDRLGIPCQTLIPRERDLPPGGCQEYLETADPVDLIAVGGNALGLVNIEYRFPIFASLRGAVFLDGGNVWSEFDRVDISEARWGAGVGARYRTPVGPVRLDVGFNLDPEPWEDKYEIFLTLGYAF